MSWQDDIERRVGNVERQESPGYTVKTWVPTWSNLTVGDASVNLGQYWLNGPLCWVRISIVLGATSSVGAVGSVRCTNLPVAASAAYAGLELIGLGTAIHSGVYYQAVFTAGGYALLGSASNALGNVQTTTPFTWATGDSLYLSGMYLVN